MPFDPTHAVAFDLPKGAVTDRTDARLVLLPADALAELLDGLQAPAARKLGAALGASLGGRLAKALGGKEAVAAAPLPVVVEQLAGEFAIAGLGVASLERWGKALTLVLEGGAIVHEVFLTGVVGGAFEAANGGAIFPVVAGKEPGRVRILLLGERGALRARALLGEGKSFADVVLRLTEGATA
jgi:hypothetical protein